MISRQLSLFRQEPTSIQQLHDWLADERNGQKLEQLLAELQSSPPKRRYSRYHVRKPDDSIDRRPKTATLQRNSR
jgi:hypothetical protein